MYENFAGSASHVNDILGRTNRATCPYTSAMGDFHIGALLADLRKRSGMSVRETAEAMGVSASTYSSYERKVYKRPFIPVPLAKRLAGIWSGRGEPPIVEGDVLRLAGLSVSTDLPAGPKPFEPGEEPPKGGLTIYEYDVSAGAGDGLVPQLTPEGNGYVIGHWVVPKALLPPQYQGGEVAIVTVLGDSMVPEIMPFERVMVDIAQTFVGAEGIYLIWDDGLLVKRVQRKPGKMLRIISANPAHEAYEQPVSEVRVLGRVIGRWEWK